MQYDKFSKEQQISLLNGRIEGLERNHAERDATITDLTGRLNIATKQKNTGKIQQYTADLKRVTEEQEETEQALRLLIANRDALVQEQTIG